MRNQRATETKPTNGTKPTYVSSRTLPFDTATNPIVRLQQTIGNRGVQVLLRSPMIQQKLTIRQAGDIYEQEADRAADQVMRMPNPAIQRSCSACAAGGSTCAKCDPEKEPLLQRKTEPVSDSSVSVPDDFLRDLGPGEPLDSHSRTFFEPRFGHDFGDVRVHSDTRAAESALAVNALAYTSGYNIVFGAGQYRPETSVGWSLLAHELTHIVQQSRAATVPSRIESTTDRVRTIQRKLRVDDPQTQAKTPMESPYIIFQDALARICDRIVIYSADDLVMEKWPLQRPRAIEGFVRRAMDSSRVYRLRLGATDLGGRQVRGASWERKGDDVVLTFNPAHLGEFTWTVDELLAQEIVSAVAANDPEEIPSRGTEQVGTMEELMAISSVDYM